MKDFGCLFLVGLWTVFVLVVGCYDIYKIAQFAARQEIARSHQ